MPPPPQSSSSRRGAAKRLAEAQEEIAKLKAENKTLQRQRDGAVGAQLTQFQAAEELRETKARREKHRRDSAFAHGVLAGKEDNAASAAAGRKLSLAERRLSDSARTILNLTEKLKASQLEHAVEHSELAEALAETRDRCSALQHDLQMQAQQEAELRAEMAEITGQHMSGPAADPQTALDQMREEVGVRSHIVSVPTRTGTGYVWANLSTRHMAAVLRGRPMNFRTSTSSPTR